MVDLRLGDCLDVLPTIPTGSVDVVFTDPPYPCIKREYGTWTEAEWFEMMRVVVPECMRTLKPTGSAVFILQPNSERVGRMRTWLPTGSAVFILQPNSERVGRMRTWLWEFMLWVGKEWGIVQDAWWWNPSSLPSGGINRRIGLMRPAVKACVWVGRATCWRNQDAVLWTETEQSVSTRAMRRFERKSLAGQRRVVQKRMGDTALERGGVTPFNILPIAGTNEKDSNGAGFHSRLASWWLRYLCPPDGTVLDPFSGSGTVALAAMKQGKHAIGIERIPKYHAIAQERIIKAQTADLFAEVSSA